MKKRHKTAEGSRSIRTKVCKQRGCRFEGKEAQQGVCYSSEPELLDLDKWAKQEGELMASLDLLRRHSKTKRDYVRSIEAHYVAAMMNWTITLDECVQLRARDALRRRR